MSSADSNAVQWRISPVRLIPREPAVPSWTCADPSVDSDCIQLTEKLDNLRFAAPPADATCSIDDSLVQEIKNIINVTVFDQHLLEIEFDATTSHKAIRNAYKQLNAADELNSHPYECHPSNFDDETYLCISKHIAQDSTHERIDVRSGKYMSIQGDFIESVARDFLRRSEADQIVPEKYRANRRRRDGSLYHITMINQFEMQALREKSQATDRYAHAEQLLQMCVERVKDDWSAVGIGRLTDAESENEVYFIFEHVHLTNVIQVFNSI
jgi:hypothetical protein